MGTKVRMSDIAKTVGVSTVTVSRALAGKEGVGDAMRERILRTAMDMGYHPKISAKPSANAGTINEALSETVGILLSCRFIGKGRTFYWDMCERVLESLSENDIFGILEPVKLRDESEGNLPRLICSGDRIQALLLIGQLKQHYVEALAATGLPIVQLDAYSIDAKLDTVISDGYYGMYAMTAYLLRCGHRKIAYVGSIGATSSIADRYFGYCRALQERNIPVRQDWVIPDRKEHEKVLLPLPEDMPTAFVCNCDSVAYNLIQRLNEEGFRVPEDVSVVGFDGYSPVPVTPALATYAVNIKGMAEASVKQLMNRLADPDRIPEMCIVPGHFVAGKSVKSI